MGYQVSMHAAVDLTIDHTVPISAGGDAFDPRNLVVMCRACNGRKRDRMR
jgi:5-methylcytosine-specific restriction endonuclease McrA